MPDSTPGATAARIEGRELVLERTLDAPRELVFKAFTEPERMKRWFGPHGWGLNVFEADVRPGGVWRASGYTPTGRFSKSGVFVEGKRPQRLVFTWAHHESEDWATPRGHETTVRVELRAIGGKTELTLTQGPFIDTPRFNAHDSGWKGSFDKLSTYLGRMA